MRFWLMKQSIAIAVLPVWRSPMISSRWPRPIGISASIGLEAGHHRLVHRLARDDARRLDVDQAPLGRLDRALAVDRVAQRVDHAAEQALADRHVDDRLGALDDASPRGCARSSPKITTPTLSVSRFSARPARAVLELDHLAGLDLVEPVDAGDAVADREHAADLGHLGLGAEIRDLLLEDGGDLGRADVHQRIPLIDNSSCCSLVLSDASTMREPMRTTSPPSRPDRPRR